MTSLAEEFFLLACDEATGRLRVDKAHLDLALGGAVLLDLEIQRCVTLVDDHIVACDRTPRGPRFLTDALTTISADSRQRGPDYWVRHLSGGLRQSVQDQLIGAGVLGRDDHKALGFIPVHTLRVEDTTVERRPFDRLRDAVLLDQAASPETRGLASLTLAVGLDRHLFPRSDREAVRTRLAAVAAGMWAGDAVRQAIGSLDSHLGREP